MNSDEAPVKAEEAKAEDVSPAQPAQEGDPAVSFALPISKTQAKKAVRKAKCATFCCGILSVVDASPLLQAGRLLRTHRVHPVLMGSANAVAGRQTIFDTGSL